MAVRLYDFKLDLVLTSPDQVLELHDDLVNPASIFLHEYSITGAAVTGTVPDTPIMYLIFDDLPTVQRYSSNAAQNSLAMAGVPLLLRGAATYHEYSNPPQITLPFAGRRRYLRLRLVDETGAPATFTRAVFLLEGKRAAQDSTVGERTHKERAAGFF